MTFSATSRKRLSQCDSRLQAIFNEVIKHWDCTILEGHRDEATQNKYFNEGRSKVKWPNGKHNKTPSVAVDAIPYPIDWNDLNRIYAFAGFVLGIAAANDIKIRFGGDWDGDKNFKDQSFNDLVHFELED